MKAKDLRNSILQLAVQGKLVPQDPSDEPASVLLERIRAERAKLIKEKKIKAPKGGESVIYRASDGSHYEKRGKGEPVCIDNEIPFEIPESWAWVRLVSAADVQLGKMLDKQKNQGSPKPYLANINVKWGRFDLDDVKTMLFREEELDKFRLQRGDLMVCEGGVPGRCAIWDIDEEMYYQKAIHRIRCIDELLSVRYCSLVIDLIVNSHALDSEFTGTTIKHLPARVLEQWKIPLPPYAEQLRIVERVAELLPYVDDYGALENARERLDAELPDKLRKSILQLAVQGKLVEQNPADEPASVLLDRIRAERAALVKAKKLKAPKGGESVIYRASDGGYYEKRGMGEPVCIDDEIPFEIPENWAWARMSTLCNFGKCVNIEYDAVAPGTWNLDLEDLEKDSGHILQKKRKQEGEMGSTKHVFSAGMVLYSKLRPYLNKVAIADEDGVCTSEILPLRFSGVISEYAQIVLMAPLFVDYAKAHSYGVKMPRLGTTDGASFLVPVPPAQEQMRIVEAITNYQSLTNR